MILCFGDSITRGIPGVSYLRYVNKKRNYANMGLGGDTLLGVSNRINKALKKKKYINVNQYIIEIGCNDVLLPYLRNYSLCWKFVAYCKSFFLGSIPCKNRDQFKTEYEKLLQSLISNNKKVLIIGIPYIEDNKHGLDTIAKLYNQEIFQLCRKYSVTFIDIRSWQLSKKGNNKGSYFFGKTTLGNIIDAILTTLFPFSSFVSKYRDLVVTIDGVHFNSFTAKGLAKLIETELANNR